MEKKLFIEYNTKEYEVKRPTLQMWNKLQLLKDIEEEKDFRVSLISLATGMREKDVRDADWLSIMEASQFLSTYFLDIDERFYKEFEMYGVKYQFIDLNNLTFGEFIDIDDFLNKDELYRKSNMNLFMAMLYREVDEDGKLKKYNSGEVLQRAELFKNLDLKYLQGALLFFWTLETTLHAHTHSYLRRSMRMISLIRQKLLRSIGDGMEHLFFWRQKTSQN